MLISVSIAHRELVRARTFALNVFIDYTGVDIAGVLLNCV